MIDVTPHFDPALFFLLTKGLEPKLQHPRASQAENAKKRPPTLEFDYFTHAAKPTPPTE